LANYFTLTTSDDSKSKKFRVIYGGYANILEKAQSIDKTIDGNYDISVGSIHERYVFSVRVREEEPDGGDLYADGWGTEADLRYFYSLNNPLGTPSNHITFTDHFGNTKTVVMLGDYNSQLQGIMVTGQTAWSVASCTFVVIG